MKKTMEANFYKERGMQYGGYFDRNGKEISQAGLVIRPGQRIYLERYLDIAKKFKFETYEVEDSNESKEAIAKNGEVKVEFFYEQNLRGNYWYGNSMTINSNNLKLLSKHRENREKLP